MLYLAKVVYESYCREVNHVKYLGVFDTFNEARKEIDEWFEEYESYTYSSASGWIISFKVNEKSNGQRKLIRNC